MNPLDAGFRDRTTRVFWTWRDAYHGALVRAQHRGLILQTVDPAEAAHLLVAQMEGTLSLARNSQDPETLTTGARALRSYMASLRATAPHADPDGPSDLPAMTQTDITPALLASGRLPAARLFEDDPADHGDAAARSRRSQSGQARSAN